ncbi:MAG: LLM class flavin-dependent oxidoreductase [Pseudomonadales bacterium]
MQIGWLLSQNTEPSNQRYLHNLAREIEGEGFDSMWIPQAVGRGFMVPDPFSTLAVVAAATERVEVGTAILQLPLYGIGDLIHRTLSLRQIAGSRLTSGIGAGSTESDFVVFGADYANRFRSFDCSVEQLREGLSTGVVPEVSIDLAPAPEHLGCPNLIYGTWGKGVERAAREFNGWVASAFHRTDNEVIEALARYREAGGTRAIASSLDG